MKKQKYLYFLKSLCDIVKSSACGKLNGTGLIFWNLPVYFGVTDTLSFSLSLSSISHTQSHTHAHTHTSHTAWKWKPTLHLPFKFMFPSEMKSFHIVLNIRSLVSCLRSGTVQWTNIQFLHMLEGFLTKWLIIKILVSIVYNIHYFMSILNWENTSARCECWPKDNGGETLWHMCECFPFVGHTPSLSVLLCSRCCGLSGLHQ